MQQSNKTRALLCSSKNTDITMRAVPRLSGALRRPGTARRCYALQVTGYYPPPPPPGRHGRPSAHWSCGHYGMHERLATPEDAPSLRVACLTRPRCLHAAALHIGSRAVHVTAVAPASAVEVKREGIPLLGNRPCSRLQFQLPYTALRWLYGDVVSCSSVAVHPCAPSRPGLQ